MVVVEERRSTTRSRMVTVTRWLHCQAVAVERMSATRIFAPVCKPAPRSLPGCGDWFVDSYEVVAES
uniref:Uncharacterized protein n=3 Tax=Oryza TaxID=4527 RepID=A0A0E0N4F0_ORYRU